MLCQNNKAKAESVGLKWEDFKITDNSCAPHPPRKGLSRVRPAGCLCAELCSLQAGPRLLAARLARSHSLPRRKSVGLKWEDFKITDNSCAPHPPRKGLSRVRLAGCLCANLRSRESRTRTCQPPDLNVCVLCQEESRGGVGGAEVGRLRDHGQLLRATPSQEGPVQGAPCWLLVC